MNKSVILLFIAQLFTLCYKYFLIFNFITISCIYLVLTPNSRSKTRAGVSLNIHSFIHSFVSDGLVKMVIVCSGLPWPIVSE